MIETLLKNDGSPCLWGDGSHVMIAFDDDGAVDWTETRKANPWAVRMEEERGAPGKRTNLSTALDRIIARFDEHKCHDCHALPGQLHEPGCDTAICPNCGKQAISCPCGDESEPLPWTGTWPGTKEAIEYGFWCRWTPLSPSDRTAYQTSGWIRCKKEDHGARVDLNRVLEECTWDKVQKRWVRTSETP
jgi:hypothetical protein